MTLFWRRLKIGLAAGLAGAAAMHLFRLAWEFLVSQDERHTVFGFDREADVNAARLSLRLFFRETLPASTAERIGLAMHYGYAAAIGMVYQFAWPEDGGDTRFALLLWLCADEIPISATGISDPFARSLASHASALAAHLVFAGAASRTARLLEERENHAHKR